MTQNTSALSLYGAVRTQTQMELPPNLSPRLEPENCKKCGGQCCKYFTYYYSKESPEEELSEMSRLSMLEALSGKVEIIDDGDYWMLKINSPCIHLTQENECAVYTSPLRPLLCRKFPHESTTQEECPYTIGNRRPDYEERQNGFYPVWVPGGVAGIVKPGAYYGNKKPVSVTISAEILKEALSQISSPEWHDEEYVRIAIYEFDRGEGAVAVTHPRIAPTDLNHAYAYTISSMRLGDIDLRPVEEWNQEITEKIRGVTK